MTNAFYPVHVVYGGAHLFRAETPAKLAQAARDVFAAIAPDAARLGEALDWPLGDPVAVAVHERVTRKLAEAAIEDYRIDFEDGFGARADEEEDRFALAAAQALAQLRQTPRPAAGGPATALPRGSGIRIKSLGALSAAARARGLRTLALFHDAYFQALREHGAILPGLPPNWVVTLPKVEGPEEVRLLLGELAAIEARHGLAPGVIGIELMAETPRALLAADGRTQLPALVAEARGRCRAVHFGAYDYLSSLEIAAPEQSLGHAACDFARQWMQLSLAAERAGGLRLADGATNTLPIPPHRVSGPAAPALTPAQTAENRAAVGHAWRLSAQAIRRGLHQGFYQGWDLHPAQIPVRFAETYFFFRRNLAATQARLRNFLEKSAQATRVGAAFDDAATGQGMVGFFVRGVACGALDEADAAAAGLRAEDLQARSGAFPSAFPALLSSGDRTRNPG